MSVNGLLIDYDFCTGCYSCEVACQQEHGFPPDKLGIKVTEYILDAADDQPTIFYLPFPTHLCNLCAERTGNGEPPSCVKHCQANCMSYGPIEELVKQMAQRPKMVLFRPR
jgi:Fe-S-cluster-containing dehydrogenase component